MFITSRFWKWAFNASLMLAVLGLTLVAQHTSRPVSATPSALNQKLSVLHSWRVPVQSAVYPGIQWEAAMPQEVGFDPVRFDEAMASLPSPAVVIRHGKIVGAKGNIARSGYIWSASKSLTALIAGRLIQQGHISYDQVVPGSNVPTNPPASYRQFMSMTSDFHLSPHNPGGHYAYNNGAVVHYGDHMKDTYFPGRSYEQLLRDACLTAIGSEDHVGFHGYISGWSGGWSVSTRDLARVGYMVLRNGAWNGQQIVPASFVNDLYQNQILTSATESPDRTESFYNQHPTGTPHLPGAYSFGFWLPHKGTLSFGRSSTEAIAMSGAYGTSVIISRATDLVIAAVNTSDEHQGGKIQASSLDLFARAIIGFQGPPSPTPTPTPTPPHNPGGPTVASFSLINADTHSPIEGFNPIPQGAALNLSTFPTRNLNIRANTAPSTVGNVHFTLNNIHIRSEGAAPYALAGDSGGEFYSWTPAPGAHVLVATAFDTTGNTGGSLTLSFTVTD